MKNLFCLLSIIGGEMEHYPKSNCSFSSIPDQTPDSAAFFVPLDYECVIRIGNDAFMADCVTLIGVIVRKKTSEGHGIGSVGEEIIQDVTRPNFSTPRPGNRHPTPQIAFIIRRTNTFWSSCT